MIQFNNDAVGALRFTVTWTKDSIVHEEIFIGRKFNAVNDIFPTGMREALEDKRTGESVTLAYAPRRCIPRFRESRILTLPLDRLRKKTVLGRDITPSVGRFYPQGHINGLLDVYPGTLTPFRLIGLTENTFTADCNHPLATIPVIIEAKIQYMERRDTGTYGALTHWREKTCDWGPGMQTRHQDHPTDFFLPGFFDSAGQEKAPPAPPAMDATARRNIQEITARFVDQDRRVLDLSPGSPTPSGTYDAAVCLHTIEYLPDPIALLEKTDAHLAPGSPVVIAFTENFDPNRVIRGWIDLHPFERMGLILEYLRLTGLDDRAATVSLRNDWRPREDALFLETRGVSDPVYVVCGHKR